MKCPKCGENIADSAKFCTKCGCNIPEALEEKKKQEAEEIAKRKAEEEKQKIEEEKAAAKVEESEIESQEKIEETKETESKEAKKENKSSNKTEKKTEKKTEEKTKKKKKHTGLKIIIILIILLIVVCAIAYGLYKIDLLPDSLNDTLSPIFETVEGWFDEEKDEDDDKAKDKKKDDKENNDEKEENKIKKADEDEDLVYDHYNKKILGNTYKVPEINLDYEDVKKINKEIIKLVDSDLKELEKETELPEMAPTFMDYIWTQNDNILSLVFFIHGYHVDYYYVYNVDVYTGEEIDNEDILKVAKIDEDDFDSMCSNAVEDYYENYLYYKGIEDNSDIGAEYKKAKSESIKESNFDASKIDMFLNKNGEVTIIAKLTTIAGAGIAYAPVNIENLRRNSKPLFEVKDVTTAEDTKKTDTKTEETENKTANETAETETETTNTSTDTTNSTNTTDTENTVR